MYGLIALLVIAWLALTLFKVAGGIVHILLVVAVVLFLFNLFTGRKAAV